ncbi:MAG: hypothetical protein GTO54_11600 [Nitrososphaeria archaeon]|nr:hypothetical protein [Nitrososphaeria archaeon]
MDLTRLGKGELIERAKQHIFSLGLSDVASYLCRMNMKFGLAKIHYAQHKLGMKPNATFTSAPDETVTRNRIRWESGIGYGGKAVWGDGEDKAIFLEFMPNTCGMLVGGLKEQPKPDELIKNIYELGKREDFVDDVKIAWDFHTGNHFIDIFRVVKDIEIDLPDHVFVIHSAAPELRGDNAKGPGLYHGRSSTLREMMKEVETPLGKCKVVLDGEAERYLNLYRYAENFAKERRRLAAKEIFGDFREIINETHQGLLNYNEITLGCHHIDRRDKIFPITLRADLPAYLVRGKPNLLDETIEALGFYRRAERIGVLERLRNLNILPHGGGYTFPDMLEVSGEMEMGSKRYFKTEMKSGIGQKIISNTDGIQFMYRGREVVVRALELRMCDIVARLIPSYILKIS